MCGIAGVFSTKTSLDRAGMERVLNRQIHRGPDAAGFFSSGPYTGGMRRLSINDLHTGDQPLYNTNKDVVLFYNGEIYNFPELRKSLEQEGVKFRTRSDGEVICHLYDRMGKDCFSVLDGMFACALWDEKKQKLFLARDIPGEKPLYYGEVPGGIAFSSDLGSLTLFPGVNLKLDLQSVWDFPTFLWIPEPRTVYQGVHVLKPGHVLEIDSSKCTIEAYQNRFDDSGITPNSSDEEVVAAVKHAVTISIRSRLLSDVPVGSFLSGGLDSSIIAMVASKEIRDLQTFTIGFDDSEDPYHGHSDESEQAREFANKLGTKHHTLRVNSKTFKDLIDPFLHYSGQPFSVSSGFGIFMISKFARERGVKVLLSGDGADECFGGYSWYTQFPPQAGNISKPVDDVSFHSTSHSVAEKTRIVSSYTGPLQAWAWHYYASELDKSRFFSQDAFQSVSSSIRKFAEYSPRGGVWTPEEFIRQDRKFYFVNEMLQKVDRMAMANSIEGRPPFAAPRLLALADHLSYRHCIRGSRLKWVLREAFKNELPDSIISRPKHGFNVPVDYWFKNEWKDLVEETVAPSSALHRHGLISKDAAKTLRELTLNEKRINGHAVLSFVFLNRWLQNEFRGTI